MTQLATGLGSQAGRGGEGRLEQGGRIRIGDQDRRVVGAQAEDRRYRVAPRGGQLGQRRANLRQPGRVEVERRQVGLREVAVVVRGLLDPHPVGLAALVRPAAGLLDERLAGVERRRLPLDLVRDRPLDGAERVHVLDLDPRPERLGPARPERDVRLDPQLAALHVRVGCADRAQQQLELLGVAAGLLGGPDLRLGDDLHQRRPGPVEVDQADLPAVGVRRVDELGRVLLEVRPGDGDRERARRTSSKVSRPSDASGRSYWLIW